MLDAVGEDRVRLEAERVAAVVRVAVLGLPHAVVEHALELDLGDELELFAPRLGPGHIAGPRSGHVRAPRLARELVDEHVAQRLVDGDDEALEPRLRRVLEQLRPLAEDVGVVAEVGLVGRVDEAPVLTAERLELPGDLCGNQIFNPTSM